MHVDADRDGRVDNDTSGLASWTRQRGAIILCNNDVDQGSDLDNANATVDGADDVMDLAPLVIRRTPTSLQFPGGYTAFLSVDRPEIRIFNRRAAGASEIIGPTRGRRYEIPDLSPQETTYAWRPPPIP